MYISPFLPSLASMSPCTAQGPFPSCPFTGGAGSNPWSSSPFSWAFPHTYGGAAGSLQEKSQTVFFQEVLNILKWFSFSFLRYQQVGNYFSQLLIWTLGCHFLAMFLKWYLVKMLSREKTLGDHAEKQHLKKRETSRSQEWLETVPALDIMDGSKLRGQDVYRHTTQKLYLSF